MAVAETSKQAFANLKKLGDKQQQVFDAIGELGVASDDDIAQYLGWTINRVNPRRGELRDYGYIGASGRKMGRFGSMVDTYHCIDPNDKKLHKAVSWLYDEE